MSKRVGVNVTGLKCDQCGGTEFVRESEREELICVGCGNVLQSQKIETGPEWRFIEGEEEKRVRVGMPPTLLMQDKGLSTLIGAENEDSSGRRIVGRAKRDISRLRKWQQRISVYSSKERNLSFAMRKLNKIGEKLEVPYSTLERASYLYRMALDQDLIRGRSINSIVIASLFAALRYDGVPRTLRELSDASDIPRKELARDYRMLVKELRLKMPVVDPLLHVRRIAVSAGLDKRIVAAAIKVVRLAQRRRLTGGKDPRSFAAAAIYYSCELTGVDRSQRDIAIAANVTEVTVRNRYNDLSNELRLEAPLTVEKIRQG